MLLAAAFAALQPVGPAAALRVAYDGSEWSILIEGGGLEPYRATLRCTERCSHSTSYSENVEAPLGLLVLSEEHGLILAIGGTGSAYIVRVWALSAAGVRPILVTGTRGWPDVYNVRNGDPIIRTYERPQDAAGRESSSALRAVSWRYRGGRFTRAADRSLQGTD